MFIRLLTFGPLREARGTSDERIEVPSGTTAVGLYATLFPREHQGGLPVSFVRNLELVPPDTALADGDEVGLLPPVGGG